jgi:hypothetical protein
VPVTLEGCEECGQSREKKMHQSIEDKLKLKKIQPINGERCEGSVTKHVEDFSLGHSNGPLKVKSNDYEFCFY